MSEVMSEDLQRDRSDHCINVGNTNLTLIVLV